MRSKGLLDKGLEWLVGRGLVILGKRAWSRGDIHEYRHYLQAVRGGNSQRCEPTMCALDKEALERYDRRESGWLLDGEGRS